MTVKEVIRTRAEPQSQYASRARYPHLGKPVHLRLSAGTGAAVPGRTRRAFDPATPTGAIALDAAGNLGTPYPATTPTLLCRYLKIRAGEQLPAAFAASGAIYYVMAGGGESRNAADLIAWGAGDVFCLPGGGETMHRAAGADCLLFVATDEPLLAFERLSPPSRKSRRSIRCTGPRTRSSGASSRSGSAR